MNATTLNGKALLIAALVLGPAAPLFAHGPLFMPHYEVPGKGALDLHTSVGKTNGDSGIEIEQGVGFGLHRDFAFEVEVPAMIKSGVDVDGIALGFSYRLFNMDSPGMKKAVVLNIHDSINSHRDPATGELRYKNSVSGGLGYVIEKLQSTLIADVALKHGGGGHGGGDEESMGGHPHGAPARRGPTPFASPGHGSAAASANGESNHTTWIDLAYGYRFFHVARTRMDAMAFLETNVMLDSPGTQYLAPEVVFQPSHRMLFKLGYRFPIRGNHYTVDGMNVHVPGEWAFQYELRL